MNDISKQVLTAIIELSICKDSTKIKTPWAGLRLRATLREGEDTALHKALDDLRDNEKSIESWSIEGDSVVIALSEEQKIPMVSSLSEREIICDRAIKRALLYRLYEEYRKSDNRYVHYPLAQLKDILETTKEEIFRLVQILENEYYLEYRICDGGMCTSDLRFEGIKLCEIKSELFNTLGAIQISSKEMKMQKEESGLCMGEMKRHDGQCLLSSGH